MKNYMLQIVLYNGYRRTIKIIASSIDQAARDAYEYHGAALVLNVHQLSN